MNQAENTQYKLLLVDDHLISLKLMMRQCQIMGFSDIETASNGEDGKKILDEKHFDIVILDWAMPKRDGMSVLQECRRDARYDNTAFVMCSAEAQANLIEDAMHVGATSYLVKPVTQTVFEEKINVALAWLKDRKARKNA